MEEGEPVRGERNNYLEVKSKREQFTDTETDIEI